MPRRHTRFRIAAAAALLAPALAVGALGADPWADHVALFDPGLTPTPGFSDPAAALGMPATLTGVGTQFEAVVSMFNPPYDADQVVSIGEGGALVLEFDEPLTNDPGHRFGADLIVYGNGGFIDTDWPNGRIASPALLFGTDAMQVSVSADGLDFVALGAFTEGWLPTQAWLDVGPYAGIPGAVRADFTRPVDPALTPATFDGLSFAEALALYGGAGGGTPIDIGPAGLDTVRFVKIEVPDDANPDTQLNVEVDALAAVPEPAALVLCGVVAALLRRR